LNGHRIAYAEARYVWSQPGWPWPAPFAEAHQPEPAAARIQAIS
jgi:hypothetical protein